MIRSHRATRLGIIILLPILAFFILGETWVAVVVAIAIAVATELRDVGDRKPPPKKALDKGTLALVDPIEAFLVRWFTETWDGHTEPLLSNMGLGTPGRIRWRSRAINYSLSARSEEQPVLGPQRSGLWTSRVLVMARGVDSTETKAAIYGVQQVLEGLCREGDDLKRFAKDEGPGSQIDIAYSTCEGPVLVDDDHGFLYQVQATFKWST